MLEKIAKGDYVSIKNAKGNIRSGKVLAASHWSGDGWQIELSGEEGYSHWKQWEDGGKIVDHKKGGIANER